MTKKNAKVIKPASSFTLGLLLMMGMVFTALALILGSNLLPDYTFTKHIQSLEIGKSLVVSERAVYHDAKIKPIDEIVFNHNLLKCFKNKSILWDCCYSEESLFLYSREEDLNIQLGLKDGRLVEINTQKYIKNANGSYSIEGSKYHTIACDIPFEFSGG